MTLDDPNPNTNSRTSGQLRQLTMNRFRGLKYRTCQTSSWQLQLLQLLAFCITFAIIIMMMKRKLRDTNTETGNANSAENVDGDVAVNVCCNLVTFNKADIWDWFIGDDDVTGAWHVL